MKTTQRSILIIGHSDGIGAEVAAALLARGDRVTGISRRASGRSDSAFREVVVDVTSPEYGSVLQNLVQHPGGFDVCIYCAGIGSNLTLPDLSGEARVFEVNLTGMVKTMAALVPGWLSAGRGHFVGLSSLGDVIVNDAAPSYSASKAGFSSYLNSMAMVLRPKGVAVTNVRFGFVDTKMAKAPQRPMMMSRAAAARHVLRCLERRPAQLSVPKTMAVAVSLLALIQSVRTWFG